MLSKNLISLGFPPTRIFLKNWNFNSDFAINSLVRDQAARKSGIELKISDSLAR
jgi:hypothetical protein